MLQCECGFTCGTVNGYASHLARFSGDELKLHQLVAKSTSALTSAAPQRPVTRSWAARQSQVRQASPYSGRYSSGLVSDDDSDEELQSRAQPRRTADERSEAVRKRTELPPVGITGTPSRTINHTPLKADDEPPPIVRSSSPKPQQSPSSGWIHSTTAALRTAGILDPLPVSTTIPAVSEDDGPETSEAGADSDDSQDWSESGSDIAEPDNSSVAATGTSPGSAISLGDQLKTSLDIKSIRTVASNIIGLLDLGDASTPRLRQVSISSAQDTFLWRDRASSLRVFGLGLYLLICLQHLVSGAIVLLPTTLLSLSAIGFLVWNVVRNYCVAGRARRVAERERQAQKAVTDAMMKVAVAVIPRVGAAAGLAIRCLSGRELGPTIWSGVALLLLLMVGESQIVGQVTLMMWLWLGVFSLPWLYLQCRHALDLLVEEAVLLVAAHLSQHSRFMLAAAALSGITAGVMVNAGVVPSLCTAVGTGAGVLWWNHLRMRPQVEITEIFEED